MKVNSIRDLGTKIEFYIDVEPVNEESIVTEPTTIKLSNESSGEASSINCEGKILIVDDSEDNQNLINYMLKSSKVTTDSAMDGQSAIEKALSNTFDVILMDVQMPVMDGIEATKLLRDAGYQGPIIALTANAMEEDRKSCLEAGCNDFLTKPIVTEVFYKTLNRYLGANEKIETLDLENSDEFIQLKKKFIRRLPERFAMISNCIQGKNYTDAASECHRLKGIAGSYGYEDITNTAELLVRSIRNEHYGMIEGLINELKEQVTKASVVDEPETRVSGASHG
jgi:CheY-like chemotaxis protein/HPt (histidine-containing phosphotransfer) domain-containing protein